MWDGEGFYGFGFAGQAGTGHGVLVLDRGLVVGADSGGVLYDGTYKVNTQTNQVEAKITLTVPPGRALVTGRAPASREEKVPVEVTIPRGRIDGTFLARTPDGAVNVVIRKIRDFPS